MSRKKTMTPGRRISAQDTPQRLPGAPALSFVSACIVSPGSNPWRLRIGPGEPADRSETVPLPTNLVPQGSFLATMPPGFDTLTFVEPAHDWSCGCPQRPAIDAPAGDVVSRRPFR